MADDMTADLSRLLGFDPDPKAVDVVRRACVERGGHEEPYLIAAMLCDLLAGPDSRYLLERAYEYARRGGYTTDWLRRLDG